MYQPEVIEKNGYPVERHVISSQGYLLEFHRIPHGIKSNASLNKHYPLFLQHGFLTTSMDWVVGGPEESLGYLLADAGFDVWLGNMRGNMFAKRHVSLKPDQKEFWDFGIDEIGLFDIPAAINYILKETKKEKLVYIGYSLGTTIFYVCAASQPICNGRVLFQISLAPISALSHSTSIAQVTAQVFEMVNVTLEPINRGDFGGSIQFIKFFCDKNDTFTYIICLESIIFPLYGRDLEQFNRDLMPIIFRYFPNSASVRTADHVVQFMKPGRFAFFDYGLVGNFMKYGSEKPPVHNVSLITVPMRVYCGKNDLLANPWDTKLFYGQILNPLGMVLVNYPKWSHADFTWAKNLYKYINGPVLRFVNYLTNHPEFIANLVQNALEERSVKENSQ